MTSSSTFNLISNIFQIPWTHCTINRKTEVWWLGQSSNNKDKDNRMAKHVFKQWMFFLIKLFIPSCPFQEPRPTLSEIENSQTVDVDKIY